MVVDTEDLLKVMEAAEALEVVLEELEMYIDHQEVQLLDKVMLVDQITQKVELVHLEVEEVLEVLEVVLVIDKVVEVEVVILLQ